MPGQSDGNTPRKPKVNLPTFAEFLSSSASKRWDCVRSQIEQRQRPYRASAFYRDFSTALIRGRQEGADELNLRRCVSQQRDTTKHANYAELATHWLNMPKWHWPVVPVGRALWTTSDLAVSISPELGLQDSGGDVMVALLWLRRDEIPPEGVRAIHWLMKHHMPQLHDGATPVVIDVRREKAHVLSRRRFRQDYETLLCSEAQSLGSMWLRIAQTA